MAQGRSLFPILFSIFVNDLLKEVQQADLRIQLRSVKRVVSGWEGSMLFADNFERVSECAKSL